jgi:hypothetical protein
MADPTIADLLKEIKSLSAEITSLKADVATMKDKSSTAESSGTRRPDGARDTEPPPRPKRWDFPRFDGTTDPLLFLNKFEAYFRHHHTMAEERVGMASYHLDDVAQLWYSQLLEDDGAPTWGRFKELLNLRFGPPLRSAPLFELAECRRTGTVEEYSNRFQALLPRAGRLDEAQRVQLFTGGLLPPLSHAVRLHHPETLAAAMSFARQVELMEIDRQQQHTPPRTATRGVLPAPAPRPAQPAQPPPLALPAPQRPLALPPPPAAARTGQGDGQQRRLTPEEMAERRRLGLCFNCDEKFTRGHNRFCRRLFFVDGVEIDDAGEEAAEPEVAPGAPCFSLQAVAGVPLAGTMQIAVSLGDASLVALIDSGSTHNFIGEDAARRTGLTLQQRPRLTALVANGERVTCEGVIRDAPLLVDGEPFPADLFVMPLAGYDVVLGTRWLGVLGPIVWDLSRQRMTFQRQGRTISWTSVASPSTPALRATVDADALLDALLLAYGEVFADPKGLPPKRAHDHRITLKPDAQPVAVRPYRYPAAHKDELERQCAAMMEQGIVRRSDSPFSSPVLLVKKPDGSWRFCVDYRALNALTVKDAFPIPVVDELLDELHGAQFFTKLDLRSGYHQVRMRPEDVHKTAFRTHDGLYEFLVMAFGLCNAPATFQALMNDVLRPFLRRFVLVFFDDILIYSRTWADHLRQLRTVLDVLRLHQLFVKRSKCSFGTSAVAYLGHVISAAGVAMDPAKVQAIVDWPTPRSPRAVRGFLGLAGYYRKFVHNYGTIAAPLTGLLKKEAFMWDDAAATAFAALKAAVTSAPVLAMPDFAKLFIVECDASTTGFGAVLVQEGHPVAFFSRPVAPRHQSLAAYERELIGLVQAVRHWRPYLWGRRFIVKTDHYSLKYLLDQRLATIPQHHWVGKLLGFDFSVEYRSGANNVVADALSRRDHDEGELLAISAPRFDFIERLRHAQATDPALVAMRGELQSGARTTPWSLVADMVTFEGRLYIPSASPLLQEIVAAVHNDGHEGVHRTLHRLRRDFHFPNMRRLVQEFVKACVTCQQYKSDHLRPAGLLQSLPVPSAVWADIGIDFIEALPKVQGKTVILSVVDRFSKYCHFIPLAHPYTAESVANAFFTDVVRLHGVPQSIVSDRDPVFTSAFWQELMRLTGTKLYMSSAFHPQTDGQTEAANRVIVMYLRCFTGDRPRQWLRWLPWAEYTYNTAYQSSLRETPFRVVYGRDPPTIRSYEPGDARVAAVAQEMEERAAFLDDIRVRLEQAQAVQKQAYDKHHRPVVFQVGDWALLRLRQRAAASLPRTVSGKLKPRFVGPYRVTEIINAVAVRLQLPPGARLHDVFHVGVLKKFVGPPPTSPPLLPPILHGAAVPAPSRVTQGRMARGVRQVLVEWEGEPSNAATWEDLDDFRARFPSFQLEDELDFEAGRDVMYGRTYVRRRRARDVRRAAERAARLAAAAC